MNRKPKINDVVLIAVVALVGFGLAAWIAGIAPDAWSRLTSHPLAAAGVALLVGLLAVSLWRTRRAMAANLKLAREARIYQDFFDHSPDLLASVDVASGKVLACNQTLCDTLGMQCDEIVGQPVLQLYHPSSHESAERVLRKFADCGEVRDEELRLRRADGSVVPGTLNATAVRGEDGQVLCSRSSWRDLSRHRSIERALRDLAASATVHGADQAFLRRCVRDLAQLYGSSRAFVGVFAGQRHDAIRTLVKWNRDKGFVDNEVYELRGTPCQDVIDRAVELISSDVATLYSEDKDLARAGIESYCGVPLVSSTGEVMGVLSVIDTDTIPDDHFARPLHHVFAQRIAHELERKAWAEALRRGEEKYRRLLEGLRSSFVYSLDTTGAVRYVSPAVTTVLGYSATEFTERRNALMAESEANIGAVERARAALQGVEQPRYELRVRTRNGQFKDLDMSERPVFDAGGKLVAVEGMATDITVRKRAEGLLAAQNQVLERIAEGAPLQEALDTLCRAAEALRDGALASVMLVSADHKTLQLGAAPSLPAEYAAALDGIAIGEQMGSCGSAAFTGEPVFVSDVQIDPRWERFRELAGRVGIMACWSLPVLAEDGSVLGTFAVSLDRTGAPDESDRRLLLMATHLTGIVIRKHQAEDALSRSEMRFRDFARIAADYLWEMGPDLSFSYISERYREITGLDPQRLPGHSPTDLVAAQMPESELWTRHLEDLRSRRVFDSEFSWVRSDGATIVLSHRGRPVFDDDGEFLGYRGTGSDVTNAYRLSEQLAYQASHDGLTGLTNRAEFESRLRGALDSARVEGAEHALCYLDLDQFKIVNDTCGHVAGDELLRQLSRLLRARVRKRDTLARLGGDEFGVLMERCPLQQAHRVADLLRQLVEEFRFHWEGRNFTIGVSIGLVPINSNSVDSTSILRAADTACYAAKDEGRNRVHVYHEADTEVARRQGEMQWISRIDSALETQRMRLYAQRIEPIVAEHKGGDHYELLLRLVDTDGQIVLPGAFLPAAERYNTAVKLDRWVIEAACRWFSAHPELLDTLGLCAINLSGQSLGDPSFLRFVIDQFGDGGLPAERFCFEITETAAISNLTHASQFIDALGKLGCRFSLDDFGSGLSSFAYLKTLSVDFIKIDGIFVKDIVSDPMDLAMVRSINEIGHVMGKQTVAEFVESVEILEALRDIGVDYAQGYHIAKPVPIEQLAAGTVQREAG